MDVRHEQRIRDYVLQEMVGKGGFGAVYKARQQSIGRDVAIKVILPRYANDPDFIRRFDTEANIIGRLEHAHVVPLYDYWREADAAYLVMRWMPGSLRSLLNEGRIPLRLAARIVEQIGTALNVSHRKGIIHRDIKPDNILLDEDRNAYLADFGIAKSDKTANLDGANETAFSLDGKAGLDGSSGSQQTTQDESSILGSPSYVAPEQITHGMLTPLTDIYSFGIVLYEILTGEPPFGKQIGDQVLQMHLYTSLPSLTEKRSDLPPALDAVVQRATAKRPEDRFPDMLSMLIAFRQALPVPDYAAGLDEMIKWAKNSGSTARPEGTDGVATVIITPSLDNPILTETAGFIENPYKGLREFDAADAENFYGRRALIDKVVNDITHDSPFVAVIGPSGSGKSSLLKAGVLPVLRRNAVENRWFVTDMLPGDDPFGALAEALGRVAVNAPADLKALISADEDSLAGVIRHILPDNHTRLVLVVDQFEELFSLVDDEQIRVRFINSIFNAVTAMFGRFRMIVSMRADYYDRPLEYPNLGELIHRWTEVVLPLAPDALEEVIVKPAAQVGVKVEPELVKQIVQDAYQQSGLLPLLQYVLCELFETRSGSMLTVNDYRALGGLSGALGRRAEEVYATLNIEDQQIAQQIFLRLIALDSATRFTPQRVRRTALAVANSSQKGIDRVIREFDRSRLVSLHVDPITREPMIEIAHTTLIHSWPRLKQWLEDNRDEIRAQQRLTNAASEWAHGNRDGSFLATGLRLAQFKAMASEGNVALNDEEFAYLAASIQVHDGRSTRSASVTPTALSAVPQLLIAVVVVAAVVAWRQLSFIVSIPFRRR